MSVCVCVLTKAKERYRRYGAILIEICAISLAVTLHQQVSHFRRTVINLFESFI